MQFCVLTMTARCCKSAPISISAGANHDAERAPRQIVKMTTPTTGMPPGRSQSPHHRGLGAALFPRYARIMATCERIWPPSSSHHGGPEGGLLSRNPSIMPTIMLAPRRIGRCSGINYGARLQHFYFSTGHKNNVTNDIHIQKNINIFQTAAKPRCSGCGCALCLSKPKSRCP